MDNFRDYLVLMNDVSNVAINLPAVFVGGTSSDTHNKTNNSDKSKAKQEVKSSNTGFNAHCCHVKPEYDENIPRIPNNILFNRIQPID